MIKYGVYVSNIETQNVMPVNSTIHGIHAGNLPVILHEI